MNHVRIVVQAEISIRGISNYRSLVDTLNKMNLVDGHPLIASANFTLLDEDGLVLVQLIVASDSYGKAESTATNFLSSLDAIFAEWQDQGSTEHATATDGTLLLMPA